MPKSMLLDILARNAAFQVSEAQPRTDRGLADHVHFPFLAIVGQQEMKTALILALTNPRVGGVLLIGPRGTAKTVAVRGLNDLLPTIQRSTCSYGCEPDAAYALGMDAVCASCAQKLARGEAITSPDRVRLIELPLNSRLEDVVGGINERMALEQGRVRIEKGILARADRNLLYVDEINLLDDEITNAILDAAAQGQYTVRRGPLSATYRARLALIGSMNPEEGPLRPQIMDRFGLHVTVRGLENAEDRLEVVRRVSMFSGNPHAVVDLYAEDTLAMAQEVREARELLPRVRIAPQASQLALDTIMRLQIASSRAEIFTLEAARAYAAADGRTLAIEKDVRAVALMTLRHRRSDFAVSYFKKSRDQDDQIQETLDELAQDSV